jgi:hypothetical protein
MDVYTYIEARQKLASLLDQAAREGEVRIKCKDGQVFVVKLQPEKKSPLEVERLDLGITTQEIIGFIAEGRKSFE